MARGEAVPLERYFAGRDPRSRELFDAVRKAVESLGDAEMRVTKSQVAWHSAHPFAWAWIPAQYLKGNRDLAPLVLSVSLGRRDSSPRWKQVVEPRPGLFMHHLELQDAEQIDDEVRAWLREALERAR